MQMRQQIFKVSLEQNNKTDVNIISEVFIAKQMCKKGNWFCDFSNDTDFLCDNVQNGKKGNTWCQKHADNFGGASPYSEAF